MIVKPFRGLRPRADLVEKVNVPPYDVVSRKEVTPIIQRSPQSFFHVTRADALLPELDEHDPEVYRTAEQQFKRLIQEGVLIRDENPGYYVYAQTWQGRTQTGIFAAVSVDEYENGTIKRNELTLPEKEQDRTDLMVTLNAHTGPVFLAFSDDETFGNELKQITATTPVYDFTDENSVQNRFWVVDNPTEVEKIRKYFDGVNALYICDGHHRTASARNARNIVRAKNPAHTGNEGYNFFLSVVFPASQLEILPYNRAVLDLNGLTEQEFLKQIEENFHIRKVDQPVSSGKGEIAVMLPGGNYIIQPRAGLFDPGHPVESMDVAILQNHLLKPVLGIDDPRTSKRIRFIGGIKGTGELSRLVNNGETAVAFALYPVSMKELIDVSDKGMILPPKSTWFEPKLRSGLVIHPFNS